MVDATSAAIITVPLPPKTPFVKEAFVFDNTAVQNSGTTILVAINTKSGNQLGSRIVSYLRERYPSLTFMELTADGSTERQNFNKLQSPRIIVGGGDGTVAWVMSQLKDVFETMPPFALLPIGVGNELSRCVGWGKGFRGDPATYGVLDRFLHQVIHNPTNPIDFWKVELSPSPDLTVRGAHDGHRSLVCFMSVGFDAAISHAFHQLRESRPKLAMAFPKTAYAIFGAKKLIKRPQQLLNRVELTVDGVKVVLPPQIRTIQILNCHSSADGLDFFGRGRESKPEELTTYAAPSLSDGLVEVVGTEGVGHLLAIRRGARHSHRLAQGKTITITILPGGDEELIAQIDGESWKPHGQLDISHHKQCTVILGPGQKLL
eukprot:m.82450 g.82450  ORF g.82450 m.82450 type:complete len:375 (-) comp25518_c0_seq1:245-1369(-)